MSNPLKLAVMVSGNGSNLQAIIDAIEAGTLSAEIKIIISDNKNAFALKRASKQKIPSAVFERATFASKKDFEAAISQAIQENGAELICLAGFMRILSKKFVADFKGSIINIHPSLLPNFKGLHAQKQALDARAKTSGCTVHFVSEDVDAGPIIIQATVPILENDTVETLSARILKEEHKIYPAAIKLVATGKVKTKTPP